MIICIIIINVIVIVFVRERLTANTARLFAKRFNKLI